MKNFAVNTLLVLVSTLAALWLVNLVYGAFENPDRKYAAIGIPKLAQYDPLLGGSLRPGARGIFQTSEFRTRVAVNKNGMRYHEVGPKQGFRVAVLGDSFVWGHGVEVEDRFTDIIEKKLGVEMLNFGVDGYGPVQYYLLADKVLSFKPDLVVIGMCMANDLSDSVSNSHRGKYRPYAVLDQGRLAIRGVPVVNVEEYIVPLYVLKTFPLGRLVYHHIRHWLREPGEDPTLPPREGMVEFDRSLFYDKPDAPGVAEALQVTEAVLKATKEKFAAQGVPVMIFITMGNRDFTNPTALNFVKAMAARLDIPLVKSHETCPPECHYPHDGHWTPLGHRTAADTLLPLIENYAAQSTRKKQAP